jgi:hypothetical protein
MERGEGARVRTWAVGSLVEYARRWAYALLAFEFGVQTIESAYL